MSSPVPPPESWETVLHRWVDAGLVDERTAAGLRAFEAQRRTAGARGSSIGEGEPREEVPSRRSRVPVATEVVGYIGAALAAAAASLIVSNYWRDLESWSRLAVVGVVTAVAAVTAFAVSGVQDPAITRLANGLWALACAGGAWWIALLGADPLDWSDESIVLITGATLVLPTAVLLAWRRSILQHLAAYAALVAVVVGLCGQYDFADGVTYGLSLWGLGACWALLAWGRFVPRESTGYVVGTVTALAAAAMLAGVYTGAGIWLGLATAILLLSAAIPTRSRALLVVGAVGFFGYTAAAIGHYLGGNVETGDRGNMSAIAVLLVAGVALLVAAVLSARRHDRRSHESVTEVPSNAS